MVIILQNLEICPGGPEKKFVLWHWVHCTGDIYCDTYMRTFLFGLHCLDKLLCKFVHLISPGKTFHSTFHLGNFVLDMQVQSNAMAPIAAKSDALKSVWWVEGLFMCQYSAVLCGHLYLSTHILSKLLTIM